MGRGVQEEEAGVEELKKILQHQVSQGRLYKQCCKVGKALVF